MVSPLRQFARDLREAAVERHANCLSVHHERGRGHTSTLEAIAISPGELSSRPSGKANRDGKDRSRVRFNAEFNVARTGIVGALPYSHKRVRNANDFFTGHEKVHEQCGFVRCVNRIAGGPGAADVVDDKLGEIECPRVAANGKKDVEPGQN
jgi:hypothetical protein